MYRTTFRTPYDQHRDRTGQPFTVLQVIDTPDSDHDAEVRPMYRIRFADGTEIEAWPEEVLDDEREEPHYPLAARQAFDLYADCTTPGAIRRRMQTINVFLCAGLLPRPEATRP